MCEVSFTSTSVCFETDLNSISKVSGVLNYDLMLCYVVLNYGLRSERKKNTKQTHIICERCNAKI